MISYLCKWRWEWKNVEIDTCISSSLPFQPQLNRFLIYNLILPSSILRNHPLLMCFLHFQVMGTVCYRAISGSNQWCVNWASTFVSTFLTSLLAGSFYMPTLTRFQHMFLYWAVFLVLFMSSWGLSLQRIVRFPAPQFFRLLVAHPPSSFFI